MIRNSELPNASFQTHAQQFLRFHGKLHRQLAKYLFAEAVDDNAHGVFSLDATLAAVKNLVLTDFGS